MGKNENVIIITKSSFENVRGRYQFEEITSYLAGVRSYRPSPEFS